MKDIKISVMKTTFSGRNTHLFFFFFDSGNEICCSKLTDYTKKDMNFKQKFLLLCLLNILNQTIKNPNNILVTTKPLLLSGPTLLLAGFSKFKVIKSF